MCQHKLCSIKFLVSTLSPSLLAAALFQAPIIHLTATSYNREPNFPILKKIPIPDYDAILKGPTQLEKPPKDFWLGCPWAGLRPKTRVTQILVLKLKNALPKPYDELVKKFLYQNYNPQMVV